MTAPTPHTSAMDMDRFSNVFFEECAEHLADMERILVSLDPTIPDREELNALFRAAHSIKGGPAFSASATLRW